MPRHDKSGVYRISCLANGRVYIGSAAQIQSRLANHRWRLRNGRHDNNYLQAAWNKYGEGAFVFEPIMYCPKDDLRRQETWAIFSTPEEGLFNFRAPVDTPNLGRRFSDLHRKRISEAVRRAKSAPEARLRASVARKAYCARVKAHKENGAEP